MPESPSGSDACGGSVIEQERRLWASTNSQWVTWWAEGHTLTKMSNTWSGVTVDCLDVELVATFWGVLLDRERGPSQDDWVYLGRRDDALPRLVFQPVTEPQHGKVRLHLDIEVDDIDVAMTEVARLGGKATGERHDDPGEGIVVVMSDPEGHEFCITQYL